ncbi:MAG TPA: hypothetical protein PK024_09745 [Methanospirillum sp.]|uniref:hypothetical protein n=1 Tax=Methanospirillum sp. TaxID=45200 RepID=UPI002C84958B|nr:hypothetical protein [Methanospirillum sp.]HOJ97101.1 hypothetical protein [Methanospirillum sp.]HPP78913.1 hypothetical protein [Methanospirillum sp.]
MKIDVQDGHVPKRITGYVEYIDTKDEYFAQCLANYLNYENLYLLYRVIYYIRRERIKYNVGSVRYFTLNTVTIYPEMLESGYVLKLNDELTKFRFIQLDIDKPERYQPFYDMLTSEYDLFIKYGVLTLVTCTNKNKLSTIRFFTRNRVTIMPYMFRGNYESWLLQRLGEYKAKYMETVPINIIPPPIFDLYPPLG